MDLIDSTSKGLPESSSEISETMENNGNRFWDLRGVQWRIDLGILPPSDSFVDHVCRVTANSGRRERFGRMKEPEIDDS
ncbi:hypothetical protein Tco_1151465 [Tanacetum coccineum]